MGRRQNVLTVNYYERPKHQNVNNPYAVTKPSVICINITDPSSITVIAINTLGMVQARWFRRWTVTSVPLTWGAGEALLSDGAPCEEGSGEHRTVESNVAQADVSAAVHGPRPVPGGQSITDRAIALFSVNHCSPRLFLNLPSGKTSLTRWEERPRDHFYSTTWDSFLTYNFFLLDMVFGKWPETREHVHSIETRQLRGYPFSLSLQNRREIISHPLVHKGQKHMDTSRKKSTGSKAMLSVRLFLLHLPWTVALHAPQNFANSLPSLPQPTLPGFPVHFLSLQPPQTHAAAPTSSTFFIKGVCWHPPRYNLYLAIQMYLKGGLFVFSSYMRWLITQK